MSNQGKTNCNSILVIEDDDDIRNTIIDVLESEGFKTCSAINGKEALELLSKIPKPCLVLLDMMMPVMNGRQFLDAIMADSILKPLPILIVSAVADKATSEGAIGFLKKPIDIDGVLQIVSEYCHK